MADSASIRVGAVRHNPLLKRTEMKVTLVPEQVGPTLSRKELKQTVFGDQVQTVIIDSVQKPFGSRETVADARVYSDFQAMVDTEAQYTLSRERLVQYHKPAANRQNRKVRKNKRKKQRGTSKPPPL